MTTSRTVLVTLAGLAVLLTGAAFTTDSSAALQAMRPLLVRNADAPALRPFQGELCLETNLPSPLCAPEGFLLTVPTTTADGEPVERLVIEFASARCFTQPNTGFVRTMLLVTVADGVEAAHHFTPVVNEDPSTTSMTTPTRIYADPGTDLHFLWGFSGNNGWCLLTVSGNLVVQ